MNHAAHYRISLLHGKIAVFTKSSIRSTYVPGSLWDSRHPHVGHGKMPMFLGEVLPSPSLNQATRGLRRAVVDAVPSTKSKNASASGGQEEYTVPLKRMIKCSTIAASHATGFRDTGNGRNGRGNEMYRLVGRDVPGAPRAWGRHRDANGDAIGTRAAGDVGPYHGCPVNTMRPCQPRCVRTCHLVGRDVPGAPRAWGRHRDAHGDASGTRAAGDVGPYHGRPVNTMRPCRPRCAQTCHLVGRDVLGAPRAWGRQRNTHGDAHRDAGRRGRRPLPRMPREHHAPVPTALRPDVPPGRARRPRRAARMGTPSRRQRECQRARGPPGTSAPTTDAP